MELHSTSAAGMEEELAEASRLAMDTGALAIESARSASDLSNLWEARHRVYWAFVSLYPGRKFMITDTAAPLSQMPSLIGFARRTLREMQLDGSIIGHVGDGNFHVMIATVYDDYSKAEEFATHLVRAALEVDGTATGEHGIGLRKKRFLPVEHASSVRWMRMLKRLFDPNGVLNPGKVVDLVDEP